MQTYFRAVGLKNSRLAVKVSGQASAGLQKQPTGGTIRRSVVQFLEEESCACDFCFVLSTKRVTLLILHDEYCSQFERFLSHRL